uniref:Uncharacterized protein n=1 Tax=Meloidogyne enterolobii TaxID=390850 RepID=A0A6V7WTF5_MELEN|nr:unnamed protein product [Meloidogyne enterolobii]
MFGKSCAAQLPIFANYIKLSEDWKLGCTTFSEHASLLWKFEEKTDKMASLLGGYAVEKLLLGGLTDESANDMEKATEIA